MGADIILWHPTVDQFNAELALLEDRECFLVLPEPIDLRLLDEMRIGASRVSLVAVGPTLRANEFGLLRRMQRNQWVLALCCDTREIASGSNEALELTVELAHKFRVDVDFLLTLPSADMESADSARVFHFITAVGARRVSFAFPLLLGNLGCAASTVTYHSEFFDSFFDAWFASKRTFVVDDVHRLAARLAASQARSDSGHGLKFHDVTYIDSRFAYPNSDGPIAELRADADFAESSRARCERACEYYFACGGDLYGPKVAFNGTIDSADNPYCRLIAKPLFSRALRVHLP